MPLRVTLALALALALAVGGAAALSRGDGAASGLVVPRRDYGVKLCGREFIRAVIFTCGGSRWRRSLLPDQPLDPFQRNSYSDVTDGENLHRRQSEMAPSNSRWSTLNAPASSASSSSYSLEDLLVRFDQLRDTRFPAGGRDWVRDRDRDQDQVPDEEALYPDQGRGPNQPDRRRRNFSLGVAGMCCKHGCTKNDIGHLC